MLKQWSECQPKVNTSSFRVLRKLRDVSSSQFEALEALLHFLHTDQSEAKNETVRWSRPLQASAETFSGLNRFHLPRRPPKNAEKRHKKRHCFFELTTAADLLKIYGFHPLSAGDPYGG